MNEQMKSIGILVVVGAILYGGVAQAATNRWTNGGGDNVWTNAANWSAGIPTSSSDVLIDPSSGSSPILTVGGGSLSCATITITKPGGFTIQPCYNNLTISGRAISVLCSNEPSLYTVPVSYVNGSTITVWPGSTRLLQVIAIMIMA